MNRKGSLKDGIVIFSVMIGAMTLAILILAMSPWITENYALEKFNQSMTLNHTKGETVISIQKSWILIDTGNWILGGYEIEYIRMDSCGRYQLTALVDSSGRVNFIHNKYVELSQIEC